MIINKRVTFFFVIIIVIFLIFQIAGYYKIRGFAKYCITVTGLFKNKEAVSETTAEGIKSDLPIYPFPVGEKLKYNIYSVGLKVGEAIITYLGEKEVNGAPVSCISVEAKAPGFYDVDKIYGDIENYAPIRVERDIKLFGNKVFITEAYNQVNNEVLITRVSKETQVLKIESKEKISNIILLLYHFRYKNHYRIGDSLNFILPTKKLELIVDKQTEIKVSMGKFKAIFVKSKPPQFKVWFKSDTDSIPLRIQGAIGFGNTYLELTDVE